MACSPVSATTLPWSTPSLRQRHSFHFWSPGSQLHDDEHDPRGPVRPLQSSAARRLLSAQRLGISPRFSRRLPYGSLHQLAADSSSANASSPRRTASLPHSSTATRTSRWPQLALRQSGPAALLTSTCRPACRRRSGKARCTADLDHFWRRARLHGQILVLVTSSRTPR